MQYKHLIYVGSLATLSVKYILIYDSYLLLTVGSLQLYPFIDTLFRFILRDV